MLTTAIPDVEILSLRLFTACFNIFWFSLWHQHIWFKSEGWLDDGTSYSLLQTLLL